ncbi:MAG: hypothetical protein K1X65_12000 [Caldilineales bacterium]|nr:hypothetical protein [Caldilineales bacterium]
MGYWQLASLISPQQRVQNPQEGHDFHLLEHKTRRSQRKHKVVKLTVIAVNFTAVLPLPVRPLTLRALPLSFGSAT